jgi:hypothetical protein
MAAVESAAAYHHFYLFGGYNLLFASGLAFKASFVLFVFMVVETGTVGVGGKTVVRFFCGGVLAIKKVAF